MNKYKISLHYFSNTFEVLLLSHYKMESACCRYQLLSKNPLTQDETELYELTHLSGLVMDPNVFKYVSIYVFMEVK